MPDYDPNPVWDWMMTREGWMGLRKTEACDIGVWVVITLLSGVIRLLRWNLQIMGYHLT